MKLLSIEPTPSPHSMKLNLDVSLPRNERRTYIKEQLASAPDAVRQLLSINGVTSVFHTADFMAVERDPKADWREILARVHDIFGLAAETVQAGQAAELTVKVAQAAPAETAQLAQASVESFGEAQVLVQMFRGIPMQVRVRADEREARLPMPERFISAVMKAQKAAENLIMERKLVERGVRYGDLQEIAEQIVQELDAEYSDARLDELVQSAFTEHPEEESESAVSAAVDQDVILHDPDWKRRYAEFSKLKPELRHLPLIAQALKDDNFSVRRLAVVYLGDLKEPEVFPYLYQALRDPSASVRRTAGDCLSDIGDPDAIGPMCAALKDPSKIVRWRAARFLYEVGDESALPALREAENDREFEVSLQVRMAIQRIEAGEAAAGSVWQQMTRRNEPQD